MSLFVDEDIVNGKIDLLGSTVGIKTYAGTTYNDYGDENLGTASISTTVAVVNSLTIEDDIVREGLFSPQDKRFFFKSDETIATGNIVIHKGTNYKVDGEPIKHELQDVVYAIEVLARRI